MGAIAAGRGADAEFDRETKQRLLGPLTGRLDFETEQRTLFDVLARLASSLAAVFAGERKDLALPSPGGKETRPR